MKTIKSTAEENTRTQMETYIMAIGKMELGMERENILTRRMKECKFLIRIVNCTTNNKY